MNLPEFGVRRPITNLMIFFGILIVSIYSLSRLGIDQMPEIEPPVISVVSSYPGASPEDVEIKVTEVLENQLATTPGLEKITSISSEGFSLISLKFAWGTNLDAASNDIRDRIELAKRFLPDIPDEMDNPFIFKFNTAMIPILFVGITAEESYPGLHDLLDKQVADPLRQLPGVGTVQLLGGLERQINIWIDRERLEGYGFSILDILNSLRQENITLPVGTLKSGLTDYFLRLPGEFATPEEINLVILGKRDGKVVYLKDVARVEDSFKEVTMYVRVNRRPGMMMMIQKQTGVNTVEVAERLKRTLKRLETNLPKDVKISVIFDSSSDIIRALNSLKQTLWWGIFLVIVVVWFFLRQIGTSLIIALTIPFSLLIAFIYLFLSHRTINIVSLSSLAIVSGMVVDNAIVVVDNILRHIEGGEDVKTSSISGTTEMFLAILASTLTTVVVFLPMLFIRGVVGIMFSELATIVIVTLFASLFTATTFSPMLCAQWLRLNLSSQNNIQEKIGLHRLYLVSEGIFKKLEDFYKRLLSKALGHKKLIVAGFLVMFSLSIFSIRFIGNEFIPDEDTGDMRLTIHLPLGTRLEETDKVARRIEEILEKFISPEEVRLKFVRAGTAPSTGRVMRAAGESGEHIVMAGVKLVPKTERKRSVFEIGQALRKEIRKIPGVLKVDVSVGNPIGRLITGMAGKAVQLEIIGHSFEETNLLAVKIKSIMEQIPGAVDISISRDISRPELRIVVDREKAAMLGLNMKTIADSLKTYIEGSTASRYREKGETYDIYVRLEDAFRSKPEDIENLTIISPITQKPIRLSNFAKVYEEAGPVEIERTGRERVLRVECNVFGRAAGQVREDLQKALKEIVLPQDIRLNFGGEAEEQQKAFRDLTVLLLLGLCLIYMVMAAQFESLVDPFVIMFSIPFSFTGVFFGFLFTGTTLNIISFLGMVMLMGIVVNNGIVLISYTILLRRDRGLSIYEAITQAGRDRLRPVLMTTITTIVGLLPLAISKGEGSEIWRPLGITMISGLSLSTLITLIFVPVFYSVVETRVKKNSHIT